MNVNKSQLPGRSILRSFCSMSALLLSAQPLLAATSPSAYHESLMSEEIVVTARRVEESIQDVPIAITALRGKDLEIQGVRNFSDLQYSTPSLSFTGSGSRDSNRITLRGQTAPFGSDFPGVDTLFAEVPIAVRGGGSASFFDVASVQVLKGPQGVAFGRNSTGGAVLVYPNLPEHEFDGYLGLTVGRFNAREYDGMINVPVIQDTLAVRAAVHSERRDGWTSDIDSGLTYDDRHMDEWRVSMLFTPTDNFENQTIFMGLKIDTTPASMHTIYVPPTGRAAQLYQPPLWNGPRFIDVANEVNELGRGKINTDFHGVSKRDQFFASNNTRWDFTSNLTLKNIFAWQENSSLLTWDADGTPIPLLHLVNVDQDLNPSNDVDVFRTLSNEIQLQGENLDGDLRWLVGLFTSRETIAEEGDYGASIVFLGIPGAGAPSLRGANDQTVTSLAPFAQVTLPLAFVTENLNLTLGVRHTTDKRELDSFRQIGSSCAFGPSSCSVPLEGEFKGWNWAATLDMVFNDDVTGYLAHRHGFKGGAFNPGAALASDLLVEPEYVDDIELGLKMNWQLGSMEGRTNIALYHQWYDDIVRSVFVLVGSSASVVQRNVAQAEISGLEIEATIIPTDHLSLTAYYSYTDARFVKSNDPNTPLPDDKDFPDVPTHKAGLTATYSVPFDESVGPVTFSTTAAFQGKKGFDQGATSPYAFASSYVVVNMRADWQGILGSAFDASAYVKNLTDKEYFIGAGDLSASNSLGIVQGVYGEPRTWGVAMRYNF